MDPEIGLRLAPWLVLAAVPLILASATAFTKVSVVLGALRLGLGAQMLLPYGAVAALALLVTTVIMAPTAVATIVAVEGAGGLDALVQGPPSGWLPALEPLRAFVERHADPDELAFYGDLVDGVPDHTAGLLAAVPAFLTTELTTALQMAVVILVPFLVVDLLAAQTLALVGLGAAPLPLVNVVLKVLLFLAVGGWDVVIGGLARGYT